MLVSITSLLRWLQQDSCPTGTHIDGTTAAANKEVEKVKLKAIEMCQIAMTMETRQLLISFRRNLTLLLAKV